MDVVPDEVAVRRMFDELTAGQPDAPPDRHALITRRIRRHRIAQAAGTLAAIAAATVVAVGVGTSARPVVPNPGPRAVPAWALPWPDHRDRSVPQSVLDGAVMAWRHDVVSLDHAPPGGGQQRRTLIWYAGQTVARGEVVIVVFESDGPAGNRLVAGWATASAVMHGQPGWSRDSSPWVLYDVPAPEPGRGLFVGLNVHGTSALPDHNPDNWIVVLTDPGVEEVGWTALGPSRTTANSSSNSEKIGIAQTARGLAVADTGQITDKVQVTQLVINRRNLLRSSANVGVPGSKQSQVPQLAAPARVDRPRGFLATTEVTGQGSTFVDQSGYRGRLGARVRCYGPDSLRLILGPPGQGKPLGAVPCDGAVHQITTQLRLTPHADRVVVGVDTGPMTAYRVMLGTVP